MASSLSSRTSSSSRAPSPSPSRNNNNNAANSRNSVASNGGVGVARNSKAMPSTSSSSSSSSSSIVVKRPVTPISRTHSHAPLPQHLHNDPEPGRVRVAVRIRPKNSEELSDPDYADCIELQPELKRLKLRKNNWSSESYRFDEIFTETASQKRIYEVVAKPVVESVLNGYNGTVMAYGQTGTGKTYTLGRLGKDDVSDRGIMVRAMEDIITSASSASASVEVSYLQLYMESIQDLLAPEKTNIPVVEDAKTGEIYASGATVIKIQNLDHFLQQLQIGESNRHEANTKMNTESSRSHAVLMVYIRRLVDEKDTSLQDTVSRNEKHSQRVPTVRKSKLLIVDLAGSERIDKSGAEGHLVEEAKFINLSLTSLGKCINAVAENSSHIPIRDSKLTRLLSDSFGGSARTSLIIMIGPSSRHHAETTSTIMFGQRAMKVVNTVKLKEEFDYESLCRKLEAQVDHLTAAVDRQQKLRTDEKTKMESKLIECQRSFGEAERDLISKSEILEKENTRLEAELKNVLKDLNGQKDINKLLRNEAERLEMSMKCSKQLQVENFSYQKILAETTQMYESKIAGLMKQLVDEQNCRKTAEEKQAAMEKNLSDFQKTLQQNQMEDSKYQKALAETTQMYEDKISNLTQMLADERARSETLQVQFQVAKTELNDHRISAQTEAQAEADALKSRLQQMHQLHEATLSELQSVKTEYVDLLSEKGVLSDELHAVKQSLLVEERRRKATEDELANTRKVVPESEESFEEKRSYSRNYMARGSSSFSQRSTIAKICEEVGLQKILSLLRSEDLDVQTHAVKVVANLAAEDSNQEKIVQEGGLDALLRLLQSSQNATILRVASGAVANLAMNEINQGLITSKGGARLLSNTAFNTDDPQTLRMVAGAIANLCGNDKLHVLLKEEGAIKALLGMARSGNIDVIAQIARGLANFAKCESRGIIQGNKRGRSYLVEDDALVWLISNTNNSSSSTRRHVELAICHLAQNESNANDFVSKGGLKELVRISMESAREDIRNLAKKTLKLSPTFQAEMRAQ
ncbi:microtubule binding motor protein [Lithospermum erythrorhizon]|uniref:Microtubule binding motor protein n=1 Tax=Lithospermum erythrorhizon TaxID=34254 RepID=A0AAV3R355_LITER